MKALVPRLTSQREPMHQAPVMCPLYGIINFAYCLHYLTRRKNKATVNLKTEVSHCLAYTADDDN